MATVSVVLASTSGKTLGSTCRVIWCQSPAPRARDRSMYGRPSIDMVCARIRRAVPAHEVMPMTMIRLRVLGPSTVASTIASGRKGITRNQSVTPTRA